MHTIHAIQSSNKMQLQNFGFIILVISSCMSVSVAEAHLEVGEYAKDNHVCNRIYKESDETHCDVTENSPVCAVLFKNFVFDVNHCSFCTRYGNSPALVVEINSSQTRCKSFQVGDKAKDDPHCWYFYNRNGPKHCTREGNPICAVLDETVLTGGNKCDFCTKHGNTLAIIKSIGQPCVTPYSHYNDKTVL